MAMRFNTNELIFLLANLNSGHISYSRGTAAGQGKVGKKKLGTTKAADISSLDCSGFVQYVLYNTVMCPAEDFPQGTDNQKGWLENNGYVSTPDLYSSLAPRVDNVVRIGFKKTVYGDRPPSAPGQPKKPRIKKEVGHVWLVINGRTYESKGGIGPTSLLWSERTSITHNFYTLGNALDFDRTRVGYGLF